MAQNNKCNCLRFVNLSLTSKITGNLKKQNVLYIGIFGRENSADISEFFSSDWIFEKFFGNKFSTFPSKLRSLELKMRMRDEKRRMLFHIDYLIN